MSDNRRILAFGCHPDDVEFMCAGTLALLKDLGYEIHIATVCGGEMGSMTLDKEEIREVRLKECEDSANVLDAPYYWAGGEDIEVEFCHELRVRVGEVLRKAAPFLVFTHFPSDYMVDHEETSKLVRNACFSASMPNFKTPESEPIDGVPHLYYWDAMEGKDSPLAPLDDFLGVMQADATIQNEGEHSITLSGDTLPQDQPRVVVLSWK